MKKTCEASSLLFLGYLEWTDYTPGYNVMTILDWVGWITPSRVWRRPVRPAVYCSSVTHSYGRGHSADNTTGNTNMRMRLAAIRHPLLSASIITILSAILCLYVRNFCVDHRFHTTTGGWNLWITQQFPTSAYYVCRTWHFPLIIPDLAVIPGIITGNCKNYP